MAKEILAVPEEHLDEVIKVIRKGLESYPEVDAVVEHALNKWCDEEEDYLKRLQEE